MPNFSEKFCTNFRENPLQTLSETYWPDNLTCSGMRLHNTTPILKNLNFEIEFNQMIQKISPKIRRKRRRKIGGFLAINLAFFPIFGGVLRTAAKNRKK